VETWGARQSLTSCRWGDYTAEVWDPTCSAVKAGKASECGLFWTTAEYIPTPTGGGQGTTQNSELAAVVDDWQTNEAPVAFVGSNNSEVDGCPNNVCSVTFTAPAGTQNGDLLLVAMSVTDGTAYLPSMPPGWTALGLINQGGAQNFTSLDGVSTETGWLLAYEYGSVSPDPGTYTFTQAAQAESEAGGIILGYRNVAITSPLSLSARGFGAAADSTTVTVDQINVPAYNEVVAVFKVGDDDLCPPEGGCFEITGRVGVIRRSAALLFL
jgi:hypothetical protein